MAKSRAFQLKRRPQRDRKLRGRLVVMARSPSVIRKSTELSCSARVNFDSQHHLAIGVNFQEMICFSDTAQVEFT
jgi:hypothetical protein